MLVPFSFRTAIPAKTVHSGNPFDRTIGFPVLGSASKESTMSCATASAAAHVLVISSGSFFVIFRPSLSVSRKDCVVRNSYDFGQKKIFELIKGRSCDKPSKTPAKFGLSHLSLCRSNSLSILQFNIGALQITKTFLLTGYEIIFRFARPCHVVLLFPRSAETPPRENLLNLI